MKILLTEFQHAFLQKDGNLLKMDKGSVDFATDYHCKLSNAAEWANE